MNVVVTLYAGARQLTGCDQVDVELPDGATVADLQRALAERYPPAAELLARSAIAIDAEYATPDQPIPSQAEVACIPPVSGG